MGYKVIAFIGPSGCGKDFAIKFLSSKYKEQVHKVVVTTTRPPRDYEKDGIDYNFVDTTNFAHDLLQTKNMITASVFNSWAYGINIEDLDINKINVVVLDKMMLDNIMAEGTNSNFDIFEIWYVATKDKKRLKHILDREESPDCCEVCRRFLADKKDFNEEFKEELFEQNNCYIIKNNYDNKFLKRLSKIIKSYKND